ncbi:DUF3769 domain-containing protein [Crocosphaera sp. XPORK-15E]|uniref:DUF3769 domain-containing protein n=1 Tax=Crocosphaera sp. XPORK-15E TaxID=3110247 RepID=UPI002B1F5CD1|nr:DUF3769 domain-containing protein [Crocosphaera sp. XPORK-15E]MEA5535613.1 DUF3769 domain-containing protein [Crocosphaera sp. XPORK-15E]
MPPFVPPPNPPAQIQSVVANPQGQPLEALIQGHSPTMAQISSGTDRSLLPTQAPDPLQQTPPQVVEFYLSNPQDIATPPGSSLLPSAEGTANLLGNPISVGDSTSQPTSNPSPILIPWTAESSQPLPQIRQIQPVQFSQARRLVVQQRGKAPKEFQLSTPSPEDKKPPDSLSQRQFEIFPELTPKADPEAASETTVGVVELISDRQEYDSEREVVYAEGNVVMRFANGVLLADRLWINLPDQFAVAEGNVVLDRGDQTLRGERFEYYFVQDSGVIFNASGEIYQPTTGRDFAPSLPTAADNALIPNQTLNERLAVNQPLQRITTTEGIKYSFGLGFGSQNPQGIGSSGGQGSGGQINRIRFQAERMEFDAEGWRATNARLSNDPFSPPEVEIRAETATYRNIAPLVDEVKLTNSRVVLDQANSFPTQDRLIIDQRDRQPGVIGFGYDDRDRGGLFVERGFNIIDNYLVRWEVTPQYYVQKGVFPDSLTTDDPNTDLYLENEDDIDAISPPTFGFTTEFNANFDARTSLFARTSLTSLEFSDIEDRLRTKTFVQHRIGDLATPHDLRFEYNYRERLFNGSLGFQTVRSSAGLIVVSPQIPLDTSGLQLSYQGSIQSVNADTDRASLLGSFSEDNRVTLMRFQGAASLNRPFLLWYGEALPPTPEEGLKYSPTPVLPFLQLSTGVTGVTSLYGNGDSQPSLSGTIGISGQIGHFSRPFLDYTGFNLSFSQALRGDPSPFLFDRFADLKTLTWGLTQQLYGPVRFGVQSAYNIDTDEEINTDLFLEYSRRTYSILLRYNTVLKVGSLSLRISDFNWGGNPGPFDGTGIRPVIQGVPR